MIKNIIRKIVDGITFFVFYNITNSRKTFHHLNEMNFKESAKIIQQHLHTAVLFDYVKEFRTNALLTAPKQGLVMEFGVFKGDSINLFGKTLSDNNDSRTIYGFDSFEGLSENWGGTAMTKFTFDQGGKMPAVRDNVKLVKGWIDETFPDFIKAYPNEKIAFMHLDVDTYTPTKLVVSLTKDMFQEGTIIAFDQLLSYPGWQHHEYKVLMEEIDPIWNYEFISFCEPKSVTRKRSIFIRAAIRITSKK